MPVDTETYFFHWQRAAEAADVEVIPGKCATFRSERHDGLGNGHLCRRVIAWRAITNVGKKYEIWRADAKIELMVGISEISTTSITDSREKTKGKNVSSLPQTRFIVERRSPEFRGKCRYSFNAR